ncbi:aminotransferase class I/II-fold pyridoxal phosphate-dependent enzyme, partial [Escherichia coli]|uniref:aminotransferase class I/II-fold pyridoxal phosphate-dependent enzyme n=1 Tax=Escherichia coli TaxID=562 RepID=UPI00339D98A2
MLRSFGKFFGLAGARLGFALGERPLLQALAEQLGLALLQLVHGDVALVHQPLVARGGVAGQRQQALLAVG